jgi:hypothetical protein
MKAESMNDIEGGNEKDYMTETRNEKGRGGSGQIERGRLQGEEWTGRSGSREWRIVIGWMTTARWTRGVAFILVMTWAIAACIGMGSRAWVGRIIGTVRSKVTIVSSERTDSHSNESSNDIVNEIRSRIALTGRSGTTLRYIVISGTGWGDDGIGKSVKNIA